MSDVDLDDRLHVEIECEDSPDIVGLSVGKDEDLLELVRKQAGVEPETHIFERDADEPLQGRIEGRRHLRLVAHSKRAIEVTVRYEHRTDDHRFPPSATVFRVLRWAIGKSGFNLDPTAAAKANLMLPGADEPLPRDRAIGSFTKKGDHRLVLDLTLKDFTNGC